MSDNFSAIANAIMNGPGRELGENSHYQFNVAGATNPIDKTSPIEQEIKNKMVSLNFLLVRGVSKDKINTEINDIVKLLNKLTNNNPEKQNLLIKLFIFAAYQRDIENGKGERDIFYYIVFNLWQYFPVEVHALLSAILPTNHACWKDVLLMIEKLDKEYNDVKWASALENSLVNIFIEALKNDMNAIAHGNKPSLASKWAPRQQTHFDNLAKVFAGNLFPEIAETPSRMKAYRKFLSAATKEMNTVESIMCDRKWNNINPGVIPSKAMKNYRLVFQNKTKNGKQRSSDPKRIAMSRRLIQFLVSGKKINGKTLMVHEIINELSKSPDDVLQAQLQCIVDEFVASFPEEIGLILPLADVSSSMECIIPGGKSCCIDVSIALAFLISQVNGPFKNKVMTFDSDPRIFELKGATLYEKIMEIRKMPWGGSTNFHTAMKYILHCLKDNGVTQDAIKALNLIVFSDMQFNQAHSGSWNVAQELIEEMFKNEGFPVPCIIYWNLNSRPSAGSPAHTENKNVVMLSGFNQSALKTFLKGNIIPTFDENNKTESKEKNPWEILETTFSNYIWLMQAFEVSGVFPGYKAPIIENDDMKDEEWDHIK